MSLEYGGLVESYPAAFSSRPPHEIDRDGSVVVHALRIDPKASIRPLILSRVRHQIYSAILAVRETDMYQPFSVALTLLGLETSPAHEKEVLVFVPSATKGLRVEEGLAPKPDLIAILASREVARRVVNGEKLPGHALPTAHMVAGIAEISNTNDPSPICLHNLPIIAQHQPRSTSQYGLTITKEYFRLLSIGLDYRKVWSGVEWNSETCVQQLYSAVKLIGDEVVRSRDRPSVVPALEDVFHKGKTLLAKYSVDANGKQYDLFPVFTGKDPTRRPFVALASCGECLKDARILKYSWCRKGKPHFEYQILKKIQDAPGVVQIDDDLCNSRVDCDPSSGFIRNVLATKVGCYPLSSCGSAMEFLEAMYDLLEVLRYLAHEKKVLHRNIDWRSVLLVRPEDAPEIKNKIISQETDEPIKHRYRFISNIFNEEKIRIRIALCNFEHAVDRSTGRADGLFNATSTGMFMAENIFRGSRYHNPGLGVLERRIATKVNKYNDLDEKTNWDDFYSKMGELDTRARVYSPEPWERRNAVQSEPFECAAAHDAESVFFLCLVFFCRMARKRKEANSSALRNKRRILFESLLEKHVRVDHQILHMISTDLGGCDPEFMPMLELMARYLHFPWNALGSTRQGGRHEFYLHDFLQRLMLNKIAAMREKGDPIPINERPYPISESNYGQGFTCIYRGLSSDKPSLLRAWENKGSSKEHTSTGAGNLKKGNSSDNLHGSDGFERRSFADRPIKADSNRCPEEFKDILKFKKEENNWLVGQQRTHKKFD